MISSCQSTTSQSLLILGCGGSRKPVEQVRLIKTSFILPLEMIHHIDISRYTGDRNASFATLPGISVSSCFTALAVTAHTLQHTNTLDPPPMYFVLKGCQRHTGTNLYVFERSCNGSWTWRCAQVWPRQSVLPSHGNMGCNQGERAPRNNSITQKTKIGPFSGATSFCLGFFYCIFDGGGGVVGGGSHMHGASAPCT